MAITHPTTPILSHADGTAVTAQEAYDAFMNTRVLIVNNLTTYEVLSMVWYDNNSAQDNHNAVGFVRLKYVFEGAGGTVSLANIEVGDSSLVPEQQG